MARERGDAPVDPDAYAAAARPLWQSPPVLCCAGLLAVSDAAGSPGDAVLGRPSPFVPCLDPAAAPPSGDGYFALGPEPGPAWPTARAEASISGRCVLLTRAKGSPRHVAIRDAATLA
jgi:hypothetical protein